MKTFEHAECVQNLTAMIFIRRFEEIICEVYAEQEMRTPVHLSIGEEAVAVGVCAHLDNHDYLTTTHRNHSCCLARGVSAFTMLAECYGKEDGCCGGRGGSFHCSSAAHGILGTSAIVGGGVPMAAGAALTSQLKRNGRVAAAFFGDGAFEEGSTYETLNFAALHKLPLLFVCTNNFYATVSPQSARQPDADIWRRVLPFMPSRVVDGVNVREVGNAAAEALHHIRSGNGPYFLECRAYRWKAHVGTEEDWTKGARPQEELEMWKTKCPIKTEAAALLAESKITEEQIARLYADANTALYAALARAQQSPFPSANSHLLRLFGE